MSSGSLALERISRRFGEHLAVNGVSFEVPAGELLALIGASGSGKTTTLRIAAGYETPDSGRVFLDGTDITELPPQKRGFGMVFQHYALFPHMPVEENVAFGLEARGVGRSVRLDRARSALDQVGLAGAGKRSIQSLSGGEQQRVALARALVIEPRALLLDEPLSNLDPTLRQTTRDELRSMLHRAGVPALFVTHDQEDAFAIADRIALIRHGTLLQIGAPEDLYDRPASLEVARFIGRATILPAEDLGERVAVTIGGSRKEFSLTRPGNNGRLDPAMVVLRPDALEISTDDESWSGEVVNRRFTGGSAVYRVSMTGDVVVEVASSEMGLREGDVTGIKVIREPLPIVRG
ncbi:MAG: ABC transporter ATP-binding protein [Gemmatimonadaceae bacterium]|nr:ABC transporter ATP-binding protein [Gemmatimonadaceae bacterium]MDQ3242674.1 ABC transporter ATP-binding protein [Gemmatimonadota bacterium]